MLAKNSNKRTPVQFWGMGTSIGLCSAMGVLLGAILDNLSLWMSVGAGVGVILGAITEGIRAKKP